MNKLYIIIPAYNEEKNIERCIQSWYPIVEKYNGNGESRLVIIDDGSKDNTFQIMKKMEMDRPLFIPLTKRNSGHGPTVLYGYRYAIEKGADYIFQTDSDGQTDPAEFHAFWKEIGQYEAIIGKRVERGDGKDRKFVENTVCVLLRMIFGVKVEDANAPFRLMRTELVNKYISRMPDDFNIPNIMFTTYFIYYSHMVKFVPITFKPRQGGKNSINFKKIVKIGWKAIGDFLSMRKDMK